MNAAVTVLTGNAPLQFFLNQIESLRINDGFVIIFHVVLRDLSFIDLGFLCKKIHGVCFLQQSISLVFFVGEDDLPRCRTPFVFPGRSLDPFICQNGGDSAGVFPSRKSL